MKNKKQIKNLEIQRLRAFAVIMVTVAHGIFSNLLPTFALSSFYGVDLFFAISGYLVTLSFLHLLPKRLSLKNTKANLHKSISAFIIFYLKRVFRIVPLATFWMLAFLFLSVYFQKAGGGGNFNTPYNVLLDIFGVISGFYNYLVSYGLPGNISHYWSLATEMQFYTLLPLLLVIFVSKKKRLKSIYITIGILFLFMLISIIFKIKIYGLIFSQRYFTLLFGVMLALNQLNPSKQFKKINKLISKNLVYTKTILVPLLLVFLWLLPGFTKPSFYNLYGFFLAGATSVILVYIASKEKNLVLDIPIIREILEYIGNRSYSVYLCHFHFIRLRPTLLTLFDSSLPEWFKLGQAGLTLQYTLIWIGILISSEIVYHLIEKPFISLGRAYISQNFAKKN